MRGCLENTREARENNASGINPRSQQVVYDLNQACCRVDFVVMVDAGGWIQLDC